MDTIFALATAPGRAGVAVIRLSGPASFDAVSEISGALPDLRTAALRVLTDADGSVLDQALVLLFEQGASFTGERVAELHIHGSPAVASAVLRRLGGLDGLRLAEPGEFTRRALENDCLDLARVEGLADLIDAETDRQRKQALRVFEGGLGELVAAWRDDLVQAAALLEVTIDFADEEVPVDVTPDVSRLLQSVVDGIGVELAGYQAAERIREGFEIAIVGAPNVGKSTLLNRLAGRDAAITSEIAGTTRDVIEVRMDLKGLPVTFLDTAGLRETLDPVEGIGVRLAVKRARDADLRIFLEGEGDCWADLEPGPEDIVVRGKSDLDGGDGVSGLTGQGVDVLIARISAALTERAASPSLIVRERHRIAMLEGKVLLESVLLGLTEGVAETELIAEDLRQAILSLDSLVGRVGVEDLLDEIFSRFCLGK